MWVSISEWSEFGDLNLRPLYETIDMYQEVLVPCIYGQDSCVLDCDVTKLIVALTKIVDTFNYPYG
jgi:hypothetical protein